MRCFIAIEFDETTKIVLSKLQDTIRAAGVNGNYTHPSNFHLTMKFLGEIDHKIVNRLESVLDRTASACKSFVLKLGELGKFNKGNKPIIWCGLEHNPELIDVQTKLMKELAAELPVFAEKSDFSPHITLVREAAMKAEMRPEPSGITKGGYGQSRIDLIELLKKAGKPDRTFQAEGLSLMESTREDGRLKYIQRRYYEFK